MNDVDAYPDDDGLYQELDVTAINVDDDGIEITDIDSGSGSIIRSSSDIDPTKYYDPAVVRTETGDHRTISTLMSGRGPGGIVIPRATRLGGSMGWNPHKPQIINIDPDLASKGQASVVDLSLITKEAVESAVASTNGITDHKLAAAKAYRRLAIATNPVNSCLINKPEIKVNDAKQAQVVSNPSIRNSNKTMGESKAALFNKKKIEMAAMVTNVLVDEPTNEVIYEVDGFGQINCLYHYVVREGINLALGYDIRYKGHKFFPQPDSDRQLIIDVVNHDKVYKVIAPDVHFTMGNLEICVLFIVEEVDK